ncbi:hypothetical protein GS931_17435 [Rhodococcus hoagii]|nr:hypothetical protein [Prescottella equi]
MSDHDIIDAIDALVDEQMAGGEPIGGYDWSDPNYPQCPHCGDDWHGLKITRRMRDMRWDGIFDENYGTPTTTPRCCARARTSSGRGRAYGRSR